MKYLVLLAMVLFFAYWLPEARKAWDRRMGWLCGAWTEVLTVETALGEVELALQYCVVPCTQKPWWEQK